MLISFKGRLFSSRMLFNSVILSCKLSVAYIMALQFKSGNNNENMYIYMNFVHGQGPTGVRRQSTGVQHRNGSAVPRT